MPRETHRPCRRRAACRISRKPPRAPSLSFPNLFHLALNVRHSRHMRPRGRNRKPHVYRIAHDNLIAAFHRALLARLDAEDIQNVRMPARLRNSYSRVYQRSHFLSASIAQRQRQHADRRYYSRAAASAVHTAARASTAPPSRLPPSRSLIAISRSRKSSRRRLSPFYHALPPPLFAPHSRSNALIVKPNDIDKPSANP